LSSEPARVVPDRAGPAKKCHALVHSCIPIVPASGASRDLDEARVSIERRVVDQRSAEGDAPGGDPPADPGSPILATREFYDALAPTYDRELEYRLPYFRAINEIIRAWIRGHGCRTLLDVGCANGGRLRSLLEATGIKGVGIDLSPRMVEEARSRGTEAFVVDISAPIEAAELPLAEFDLVICTWMLGHLREREQRLRALESMRSLMAPGGALVLDVNNPYNAAAYGWWALARNLVAEVLHRGRAGDFVASRWSSGRRLATVVHLFTRREILALCREAGLTPVSLRYVNYETGDVNAGQLSGQICLVLQADSG
jgi:SAM-dependent methyltransferase